jgi:hypothetical protein
LESCYVSEDGREFVQVAPHRYVNLRAARKLKLTFDKKALRSMRRALREIAMKANLIEACARAAHEANRAYCLALGDTSQPSWDEAPDWQKTSARAGVEGALGGNTPEQSHECWLEEKRRTGWSYGPVKDPDKREHPCFLPYDQLPPAQRAKDALFVAVVLAVAAAIAHAA